MNVVALKLSKAALVNSETVQGLVFGRVTRGSALTGLEEPTCGLDGARTTCAEAAPIDTETSKSSFETVGRGLKTRKPATVLFIGKTIL